ncbi:probable RNA-directed DNA polymerase from transposon X-element [Trichonephila clavipes]|nr:probable RNA-directed DNA polymerase from transposon X-element [Trichonephila clavipes]
MYQPRLLSSYFPRNTPNSTPPPSPTRRNSQLKRKDEEDFEFPPLRKTARKTILEKSEDLVLDNQFSLLPNVIMKQQVTGQVAPSTTTPNKPTDNTNENQNQGTNALPPPVMMKITKTYREQVDTMKKYFPHLRLKTTGEYIKLYSNTAEQNRAVKHTMKSLGYKFYVITPKNERPIKIVIKGFPKTADPENIKTDLEAEGFEPDKVTQLIGPHLNITVDGYNGKGVTQCYTCQNFHHNSDNCFLQPRCLKCGEEHLTKDCPIKQRLGTKFCINCQVYGHMANWHGCPCFPKGAAKTNRNTYTNLYNSFVRPNFSYAQVANNTPRNNTQNKQQMAPRRVESSRQTEAVNIAPPIQIQKVTAPPIINSNPALTVNSNVLNGNNNNDIKALLSTTVQCLIQLLNAMNTTPNLANNFDTVNSAQADANQMYGLIEASCNELKKYTNENWTARLQALSTQDNSLWAVQKFLKNKRSDIPSLHCNTGTAITDKQKANILAESILTNFTENERHNNDFDEEDEIVNNTVKAFLSHPPPPTAETAYSSEIISYIKSSNAKKAPGKSKNNPASYRPIFLLSTLSKITESIILTRLKNVININNIINPNQYGFTNKLSTLHPLLNLTEAISEGFQRKKSTGAVFLDIQKAFDRVWLTGLTFKLITYNIPPPLTCLLHSYNSDRSYQVRVKDTLSNTKNIYCGVAQGSLLGPLLFNLYINDIPDYTLTKLNMFADDTAVHTTYRRISSVTYALNKHLKLLEKYYDQWKISINVEKSAAVIFTKKRKRPPPPTMFNTTIPWSRNTKYLGIIFDKNLTWRTHIQHTRNKFRKIMFKLYPLIGRNSELSRDNKVLLFTAVMRPILAYGCPVWGYAAKTNINILDTLQNSTIRMIRAYSPSVLRQYGNQDSHPTSVFPPISDASETAPEAAVPCGQGIGSWQACHEFQPSITKDPP